MKKKDKCHDSPAYWKALSCMARNYATQVSTGQDPCFNQQVSAAIEIFGQVKQKQERQRKERWKESLSEVWRQKRGMWVLGKLDKPGGALFYHAHGPVR